MKILNKIKKISGETLIEAVISLAILGMVGAAASALIIASVQNTITSSKYLVAQSLAVEGVEAVKNIVYTNMMLHPENSLCWFDVVPVQAETPTGCGIPMSEGFYIPQQTTGSNAIAWNLVSVTPDPAPPLDPNLFQNPSFALCPDTGTGGYISCPPILPTPLPVNTFYRGIYINSVLPAISPTELDLSVRIQWHEGGKTNVFNMKDVKITID